MSKEVKVNAEGKELVLKNSAGDYAIIPKNRRAEALKMLEDKCYGCLDALVASLPKTSNEGEKEASKKVEYAQEGLEVEEEEISEEVSFGEAFAKARREKGAGQTFEWRGGTYSTNYEVEPEETQREAIEPVEVTAEAEPVVSSIEVSEDREDTTEDTDSNLDTLELYPIETDNVERPLGLLEGEPLPLEGVREPRATEGRIPKPEEDPILEEFSEEGEVGDERSFSEAFREARERLGAGQTFEWRGGKYTTDYAEEVGGAGIEFSDEEGTLVEEEGQVESDVEGGIEFSDEGVEEVSIEEDEVEIEDESAEESASVEEVEGNEEFIEKWGGARVAGPGRRVIPLERQRDEAIKEGRQAIIPELYRRSLIKGAEALGYDMEDEETRKIVEGLLKKYEEQGVSGVEYQKELRKLLYKNPKAIRTALRQ